MYNAIRNHKTDGAWFDVDGARVDVLDVSLAEGRLVVNSGELVVRADGSGTTRGGAVARHVVLHIVRA
jgi:hypothetical protein